MMTECGSLKIAAGEKPGGIGMRCWIRRALDHRPWSAFLLSN
jgi:hypothetical protein